MAINLPNYERQTTILNNTVEILDGISRAGKTPRRKLFLSDGTWVAPAGVTRVFVTGGGGGGGGGAILNANSHANGASGGVTSFGTLISLTGGGGGGTATNATSLSNIEGKRGGFGGTDGGIGGTLSNVSFDSGGSGGKGGSSGPHQGMGGYASSANAKRKADMCAGGGGANTSSTYVLSGGGGGAMYVYERELNVTPGNSYPITIGKGGEGGVANGVLYGGDGGDGYLIVEWWE